MILDDTYWQTEFDITRDDLERIAERMRKEQHAFTLTELVKRLIRGRLEHGVDSSPIALPNWVKEANVLSWDQEDKWDVSQRVLVARNIEGNLKPYLGEIISMDSEKFWIKLDENGDLVKYSRVIPGSLDTQKRYKNIEIAIRDKEKAAQQREVKVRLEEMIEIQFLKHGSILASRLLQSLDHDDRFIFLENRWFIIESLIPINEFQIRKLHQKLLVSKKALPVSELLDGLEPHPPYDDIYLFSLHHAIAKSTVLPFQNDGTSNSPKWRAIQQPPPPPERAKAKYYAYDPNTFEILVEPDQRLTQSLAQKLKSSELYDAVATWAEERA